MKKIKYPRTYHFPFSASIASDDKIIRDTTMFDGKEVVITEKKDGENTTLARSYTHARSLDSVNHPSRNWVKRFHSSIAHDIPEGWRICGENLYAQHSIAYDNLKSYFYGFSVWNEHNVALSWDDTLEIFDLLGITPVETLYRGVYDEQIVRDLIPQLNTSTQEGFVCRLAGEIRYEDFKSSFAKYVREKHVQTDEHWMHSEIVPNGLVV